MRKEPIAIVGVSALFPGSEDEAGFWRDIVAGKDLITDVPAHRWLIADHYDPDPRAEDKTYCKRGAFLPPCAFDPLEFGVPPNALPATDTCQLLSLVAAKRVLDDVARGQAGEIDRERASVILGVTSGQQLFLEVASRMGRPIWVKALRESGIVESQVTEICDRIAASHVPWQENTFPGLLGNVVAGRIANRFDLHGTNCVTDAACASSLAAISMAVDELRLGRSDLVITGGADTFNDPSMFVAFSKTPALSPTGDCRPFSDRADGTVLGEGIAMFALKRLSDAERDGNHIYALIRSIGSSSDGRSKSIYAPLPSGQARAMKRAYEEAGYGPDRIELVEAHGTGTAAGDAAEVESLRMVFEPAANGQQAWCALGSVKSQVGHTKAAAGAAALFKTAMALHHQTLPPTIKVERPSPALQLGDSPFYLNTAARPWIPRHGHERRAAVSSFGFGGTNFHAVLEEYTGPGARPKRIWPAGPELLLLSAPDIEALRKSCLETATLCESDTIPFSNIALAGQLAFDAALPHRWAVVATDRQEMSRKLRQLADGKTVPGTYTSAGKVAGRVAFLFPGQGSQYLNMGAELATTFPHAMAVWEKVPETAAVVFPPRAFSHNAEEEQSKRLTSTESAQPAVGAASAALLALLDLVGVRPHCVGGHSFGEIPALFAAGGITLDAMLAIARRRGELMRDCSTEAAGMLSVRSDWERVRELLAGLPVTPANHNGPAQVVLSGSAGPLDEAERRLRGAGFAVTALPVSTAFHSPLMRPAADAFEDYLGQQPIDSCTLPFYSNRDGGLSDGTSVAKHLAQQIAAPVHFSDMIECMYADGVRTFVEVGPRDVLTSLVRSILDGRDHQAIALDRQSQGGLRALWEGLGALAASGIAMDWKKFRDTHAVSADVSRPIQPKYSVPIDGGNYARPYPPQGGAASLPPPVTHSTPAITPSKGDSAEAYRIFQESITSAHRDWQANLAKGHEAFLRSMERAFGSANGNQVVEPLPAEAVTSRVTLPVDPFFQAAEVVKPPPVEAVLSREVLWQVVADKTGYPADMLEPAMALEADLGIDSIKRVEIFSALQERFPALANMDQESMVSLRTLGDIAGHLNGVSSAPASTSAAPVPVVAPGSARMVLWQVVADKTGYPADMLEPAMTLEADLGIDSIKRVEIFSALQERFPHLARREAESLASLPTLGDIVAALDGVVLDAVAVTAPPRSELPKRYIVSSRHAPASAHSMLHPGDRVVISDAMGAVAVALAGLLESRGFPSAVGNDSADANVWISLNQSQRDALRFAKAAAQRCDVFVTVEEAEQPWAAGLSGLAKTAALEWPNTRVKSIRIHADGRATEAIANALANEILAGGPELEIELAADGSRSVPELIETGWDPHDPAAPAALPANPVFVATGGARGVTAACLKELATTLQPKFVLFGRTPLVEESGATRASMDSGSICNALLAGFRADGKSVSPVELKNQAEQLLAAREVRNTIEELLRAGAQVRYFAIDARDSSAVSAALADVRREWGPIHGLIHAAGVLADKLIADLSIEQFDAVFSTKVDGLRVLLEATADDPVGVLSLFSSVAARYGNRGQSAYAMANEVLNRVAQAEAQRRGDTCIVRSKNWGPWEGGMVTPALAKHFAEMNVPLIGLAAGARSFVQELLSPGSHVEVVIGGPVLHRAEDLRVDIRNATHPHLDDHRIQDVPVLPLVEAVGLLLRGAALKGRVSHPPCCIDVKVLRGIRLEGFHNGGSLLTVRQRGDTTFELVSEDGTRHYEANLWAPSLYPMDAPVAPPDPAPLSAAPWNETEIYGKLLFHGPEFHVIRDIEGVSEQGIAGTLRARNGQRWRHGQGGYDAGMLDGGLQLARLWGFLKLGQATLPMRIGCIRILRDAGGSPIECRVSASAGTNRILCDISFFSLEKDLLALMTGVEMYAASGSVNLGGMDFEPIAIVGRSCLFPGASTPEELWDLVAAGRYAISSCPQDRWRAPKSRVLAEKGRQPGRACTDRGGYVSSHVADFDPRGYAIDPNEILRHDELLSWVLHAARQALLDAGTDAPHRTPARTGAIFGLLCVPTEKFAAYGESFWLGEPKDAACRFNSGLTAHLLAQALNLDRGAFALDAACASSLYAIQLACDELQSGRADMMLAGAVSRGDDLFLHVGFSTLEALSPSGHSRPFHKDADGLLPSEGASFIALKRLSDAIRSGDTIHGIIRGIGISNDGRSASLMTPSERGQESAMRAAYRMAGVDPAEISLLECHATGTPVGDACELRSSGQVFESLRDVPIGSVKSNLGHPMTAAGMAGLLKLLGAIQARTRPATLHIASDEDQIALLRLSPFRLLRANELWEAESPRKAALSAFGFGGNNAHLIVEEWAGQIPARSVHPMPAPRSPLAIVSIGVIAGDCANLDQFTRALFDKGPGSRRTEAIELDLDGLGFPPSDLERSLAQQAMALGAASQAMAGAGEIPTQRTGVYAGMGCDPEAASLGLRSRVWHEQFAPPSDSGLPAWTAASVIGGLANIVANRINSRFDLRGPGFAVMAEELSGLVALRLAARALQQGKIDLAIAGAVDLSCGPVHEAAARAMLPPEKHIAGDAAVFFALKRLEDAERSGDPIYAVYDPDADPDADPDNVEPAEQSATLASRFGHAHAASGMLDAAAAVLECAHSARMFGRPWIAPAKLRRVQVRVSALGGASDRAVFAAHSTQSPLPLIVHRVPRVFVYPGDDGSRLAIVASSEDDLDRKRTRAHETLSAGGSLDLLAPDGIYYRQAPLKGELACVFPGAAAAYHGAGHSLLLAFPDIVQEIVGRAPDFAPAAAWISAETARPAGPDEKLAASTLLCQAHVKLTLDWFGLKPQAAIGFSAGETNTLLAFQVWRDPDRFFSEFIASGVFSTHLSGQFAAVNGTPWETWIVHVAEHRLRDILEAVPQLRLLAIHAPGEYLIAGPHAACAVALERVGKGSAQRIDFDMVVHCPDLEPFADRWRTLHDRETFVPADGPRFYQLATGRSYALTRSTIAEALTAQALNTLDYPRAIEQAWNDGVRVFLEHGPRGSCTSWIRKILGNREHVAIPLDLPGTDSLTQAMHAAAQLIAAGVDVDLTRLEERISPAANAVPRRVLRLPAHPPPVKIPEPPKPATVMASNGSLIELHMKRLAAEHSHFQETSRRVYEEFLATSERAFGQFMSSSSHPSPAAVATMPPPPDVVFTRAQLETAASGNISEVYGAEFQELDTFRRICRLPMPPLLLVDRVTKLEGEPRSMQLGLIHTETDIRPDSWFLHRDSIPAGLMIEAGQADMLLISWLGVDFQVRGERVYRMLGCDVKFHDRLARSGETLRYEIKITGHARQGDARIFFFQYDCFVGRRLAISVRNGQAGFFSDAELLSSTGVLWNPEAERPRPEWKAPIPRVTNIASHFDEAQIRAASQGGAYQCFGKGFELSGAQQRPPSFATSELLLFDTVTELQLEGGPWRRGHCRAEYAIRSDSWLFTSHFKDDPCLPGTIMLEGCLQLMAFYMMALGLTIDRDGWRFEPVRDETFELRCRGQVTPDSKLLICDLFVDDFIDGPEPVLYADVLGTVDGLKAFHGRRIGLKLVPGNPLDAPCPEDSPCSEVDKWPGERKAVARVNGVPLDYKALLACAWGLPSDAFGPPYARFDVRERCPRLPGPPYHAMTRITRVDGEFGVERTGSSVEAEFDLAPDAWYFTESASGEMPFSILIEAGLQPCGWLSCFTGIPLRSKEELYFRNLDGSARIHRDVPTGHGVITTRARLINIARQGTVTLVSFDVHMLLDGQPLLDMKTGFGFFTREDLAGQTGLPATPEELARFSKTSEFEADTASPRIASGQLLMIDRITGLWPDGLWPDADGSLGGRIRASRAVDPTDWYFKAHFYQDPVQPGSLGLEALIETLQFYAIHLGIGSEFEQPRFGSSQHSVWKYRGQVTPLNRKIETEVRVLEVERLPGQYVLKAEGWLWADGVRIYHMPQFGLVISEGLLRSPHR